MLWNMRVVEQEWGEDKEKGKRARYDRKQEEFGGKLEGKLMFFSSGSVCFKFVVFFLQYLKWLYYISFFV